MIIRQTRELQEILRCLPFESEIRKKGRDKIKLKDLLVFITSQLENPMFRFWIAYESEEKIKPDDEIVGYCMAMINIMPGMKALQICRIYAKQESLRKEFEKVLKDWAKEHKITKQIMTCYKNIKVFKRKYGFTPISVNMERRI